VMAMAKRLDMERVVAVGYHRAKALVVYINIESKMCTRVAFIYCPAFQAGSSYPCNTAADF